jgi:hypothetical protein
MTTRKVIALAAVFTLNDMDMHVDIELIQHVMITDEEVSLDYAILFLARDQITSDHQFTFVMVEANRWLKVLRSSGIGIHRTWDNHKFFKAVEYDGK